MLALLTVFAAVSLVIPALTRVMGRGVFLLASLVPFSALAYSLYLAPGIIAGGVVSETYSWIPQLDLNFGVRLDVLSWALTLVVTGVGGLVLVPASSRS